jgi:hypothetical protein
LNISRSPDAHCAFVLGIDSSMSIVGGNGLHLINLFVFCWVIGICEDGSFYFAKMLSMEAHERKIKAI